MRGGRGPTLSGVKAAGAHPNHSLLVIVACAVIVPAATLAVLQYRALTSLESEMPIAVRESLRQTIRAYDHSLDQRVEEISLRALSALLYLDLRVDQPEEVTGALRALLLQEYPVADQLSVARLCECPGRFTVVVSKHQDWFGTVDEADGWPLRQYLARARPAFAPNEARRRTAFLHVEIEREPRHAGLYAFRRSGDTIASVRVSREALLGFVDEISQRGLEDEEPAAGAPEFHLVHETGGAPINARSPRTGYELRESLGEPITGWALAAFYRDRSISEMTRARLQYNLALMAGVLLTLVFGVALSLAAVARQARLAEMKSVFVSNVSHEMRTPLALISLYAETLEMERIDDPGKVRDYHGTIYRESKRLAQMVNNVLDFSRIESGRRDYCLLPCSVKDLLERIVADYREPVTAAGFELKVEIEDDLPTIQADQNALSQAILNLLDNAVKYSADEKFLAIRASRRGGDVAIEVMDRGIGIHPRDQSRVFEKFHRAGNPLTPATRGSGLGLALAKHTVAAHYGRIDVRSGVGHGSCFTILLPFADAAEHTGGPIVLPDLGG